MNNQLFGCDRPILARYGKDVQVQDCHIGDEASLLRFDSVKTHSYVQLRKNLEELGFAVFLGAWNFTITKEANPVRISK